MGFPAKSGVGGGILIVIPGVMGIATFSPRLDSIGNSVRGVAFCHALSEKYCFHNYDTLLPCVVVVVWVVVSSVFFVLLLPIVVLLASPMLLSRCRPHEGTIEEEEEDNNNNASDAFFHSHLRVASR